ncbi:bifunctional diguanylate cyclase/phosphodiesterase [Comamonas sp. CMM02]|uniref:putative bifunctional diguanylate cyclase/phosphodiesterase n=1 Tax=Comamonas sp. CMM02 TaxID=2769307 RepID=UPI001785BE3E|nr:GGDEF domain-containing phosphodiesterase [Comamonas sp. CMM02]MBD9401826.1 EAL domain-containing protein [Comamonas sp. CMM02]
MPSSFFAPSRGVPEAEARYAVFGGSILYWALGWGVAASLETRELHWYIAMATAPIAWIAWGLGWLRSWRSAAWWLAWAMIAVVAALSWNSKAEQTTLFLNLVVMVVFCGWVLGTRAALGMSLAAIGLVVALVLHEKLKWLQFLGMSYTIGFFLWVIYIERRRYERQLHKQQKSLEELSQHKRQVALLYQAVDQSPDSVLIVGLDGRVRYANKSFATQYGYSSEEVIGRPSLEVSVNGLSADEHRSMRETVHSGGVWRGTLHNQRKDGSTVTESVSISPVYEDDQLSSFVEIKQDVTDRLQAEEYIAFLQNFDGLTQLPNRYALARLLEKLLLQSRVGRRANSISPSIWHAMLVVDLDRFKKFNDARGSAWSDALLQALALRLRTLVPETAFVARTTADQFAVVIENAGSSRQESRLQAYALASDLLLALDFLDIHHEGVERVPISCGIGFTVFPFVEPGLKVDATEHIMRRCSVALSQAKNQGAGKIHAYSEALAETAHRHLQVEKGLHEALEHGHLRLFVQHQVDMFGKVAGMEALVRWQHPQEGLISPAEFIPIAEESGLIIPLGDWVLEQVCLLLTHPRVKAGGYTLSANVSALQFQEPDFVSKLTALLQRTGVDATRLTLEFTESLLLTDIEAIIRKMVALRALGVQFAIDDFGTGYSSLSYLMRLPIQEIKMDQSFIRDMQPDAASGALVQACLMVAKSQSLRVVAEGVEELAQTHVLQAWEPSILCQGYLFSRPIPAEQWLQDTDKLSDALLTEL